jgi:5-hydroxyisourate hydrolase
MITTHVLDIARGVPAASVVVHLAVRRGKEWAPVASETTDARGRINSFGDQLELEAGVYRLTFEVGAYQSEHGVSPFFPEVQIAFDVRDERAHYHVPLVISPFGYSTYRGS